MSTHRCKIGWTPKSFKSLSVKNAEARAKVLRFLADFWVALAKDKKEMGLSGTTTMHLFMPAYDNLKPIDREYIRIYFEDLGWLAEYIDSFLFLEPLFME